METLAGWLYRRYRTSTHYVTAAEAAGIAIQVAFILAPACVIARLLLDLDGTEFGGLLLITCVVYPAAVRVGQRRARRRLAPLLRWLGGDRSDPELTWRTAQRASTIYMRSATPTAAMLTTGGVAAWLIADHASLERSVAIGVAVIWLVGLLGLIVVVGYDLLFLPIQQEAAEAVPLGVEPTASGVPVAVKLMGAVVAAAWATAIQTVAYTASATTREARFLVFSFVVTPAVAYAGVLVWALVGRALLRPIRELRVATQRVANGDFTVRVPTATTDELGALVASFNTMQHGLQERASLHAAFGTFVDPSLTARLLELGDDAFAGENVEVTILFIDVRGFTSYAATVEPTDAVALLNRLFGIVVPIIRRQAGHPNHFLGDGLLAVFGAPERVPDHADRAVAAALDMQRAVSAELDAAVRVGIGINTGPVIAGTIGGGGKLEYTVIGDTVNVAARVEQLTKVTGDGILLTQATALALTSGIGLIDRGSHEIRGKTEPISVLAIPAPW